MHYWYDERSAGGLKQKEERRLSFSPRSTRSCYIEPFISIKIPYVSTREYIMYLRSHSHSAFRLIRTRERFHKRVNRRTLSDDVLARIAEV